MINIISCGTCKNNPQNKNRKKRCAPCLKSKEENKNRLMKNFEFIENDNMGRN